MKANGAPEKLYVELCSDGVYAHVREWENSDNIEYTRTDAFVDKACSWLKSKGGFTIGFPGAEVKDFKNYMEGE